MKNDFSYAQDFDSLSTIVEHTIHLATPIQSTSYSVDVGERESADPDYDPITFAGVGEFYSIEGFTNYNDARQAKELVWQTLRLVDENIEMGLKLSDVKEEVLTEVAKAFNACTTEDQTPNPYSVYATITFAINKIFDYYISQGDSINH